MPNPENGCLPLKNLLVIFGASSKAFIRSQAL
jgi:hypothetical protein